MAVFKCKMCGGNIIFNEGDTVGICDSCETRQTLPKVDDDRIANLYDRANHFRRNNEFDKASRIYEQILIESPKDAEAYWSLVLCCFGIEYVEDPVSHKRVPTVNRAQYTSIYDDENYKQAIHYADYQQKRLYESEAAKINDLQKSILNISQKEEPYDIFICYKETDANGRRTPDSVLATDMYHQLVREGYKVFFSRISLEDKIGTAYEPYIFAALNSAKIMVVLGTKPEYFNAVWVKNEWSRFLSIVKASNGNKVLLPAYKDMDPYDLPEEFSHLQAQDMGKLGFMQDLLHGIKKIIGFSEDLQNSKPINILYQEPNIQVKIAPLLKRAMLLLEDGVWDKAGDLCEQVLNNDPENGQAYCLKVLSEYHAKTPEELSEKDVYFESDYYYIKAKKYGDAELLARLDKIESEKKNKTNKRINLLNKTRDYIRGENWEKATETCNQVLSLNPENSEALFLKVKCSFKIKNIDELIGFDQEFVSHPDFKKAMEYCSEQLKERLIDVVNKNNERVAYEYEKNNAIYWNAVNAMNSAEMKKGFLGPRNDYLHASQLFESISDFQDASKYSVLCKGKADEALKSLLAIVFISGIIIIACFVCNVVLGIFVLLIVIAILVKPKK